MRRFIWFFLFLSMIGDNAMADIHSGAANRLIKEKSPYLLQHAHNPVDPA